MRILLVYPNVHGIRRIPLALSYLSACLKQDGHEVQLFDATFYRPSDEDNDRREELEIVKPVDMSSVYRTHISSDMRSDFIRQIEALDPDVIGVSLLQDNFDLTRGLLAGIKQRSRALVVIGGIMPTLAPELVLKQIDCDAVIVGEGESAFPELVNRLSNHSDWRATRNLRYLDGERLVANPMAAPVDLDTLPPLDYSLFEPEHLWRPFDGACWKAGYFELTRGCPYGCTFCANTTINSLYGAKGRIRHKTVGLFIEQAKKLVADNALNFGVFCDENFLSLRELQEFSRLWAGEIRIPFIIQTRPESITDDRMRLLAEAGCASISIGIESGDEEFRRKILNRNYSNARLIEAFQICKKHGIRTTANNMIGFPMETEANIKETILLNQQCKPDSVSVAIFAPYIGCALYQYCRDNDLIDDGSMLSGDAHMYKTSLNLDASWKQMIARYFDNFNRLVYPAMQPS